MCKLPCAEIKRLYMPKSISINHYMKSCGNLVFDMITEHYKMSVMEHKEVFFGRKNYCKNCGNRIEGIFGFISIDDNFLWVYTQNSGYCAKCAKKEADKSTAIAARHNQYLYELSQSYPNAYGGSSQTTYYEGGDIVEDVGQDLTLNPSYKAKV